jgi:energy-coupling factor transport system permease protein
VNYRPGASALHAARASVALAFCAALVALSLCATHPLVLAGLLAAVVIAAALAGVGRELAHSARWSLPFALIIALINPLVSQNGLHVIARLPQLPLLGQLDITLEACVAGAVYGLRLLVIGLVAALFSLTVNPDELLRAARRRSMHSALAATLATRMWPVLARDHARLAEARRCLAGGADPTLRERAGVARAMVTGALERAVDVAATLELRGYAGAARPQRSPRPLSRHDLALGGATLALCVLAAVSALGGLAHFNAYPQLQSRSALAAGLTALAIPLLAFAPFLQRSGVIQ